jgi:hypothetical protein
LPGAARIFSNSLLNRIPFRIYVLESTGIDNEARLPHFGKSGMGRQAAFERDYGNSCKPRNKDRGIAEPSPCQDH